MLTWESQWEMKMCCRLVDIFCNYNYKDGALGTRHVQEGTGWAVKTTRPGERPVVGKESEKNSKRLSLKQPVSEGHFHSQGFSFCVCFLKYVKR